MLLMQHHQDGLTRRLSVIGIPKYTINPFVGLMVKWEKCSGVEWTIKRLKGLKVDLIRAQSGLEPLTWIRKNRRGEISGPIGSLFRWSLKSEKNFSRTVQAFMAYTYYILPGLSETQKEKFLSAINPTDSKPLTEELLTSFRKTVSKTLRKRPVNYVHRPLVTYQGSPEKKSPRLFGAKSVPQNEKVLDDLQLFNTEGGRQLYHDFRDLYRPLLSGIKERRDYLDLLASCDTWKIETPVIGGEIHFLQEPGGKLRSVASPLRLHQEALRPLGQSIYDVVKSLPWDCTFDQTKALPHIQSHLSQGGQVHSIDLSSATDHFPLSLQEEALRAIFLKKDWIHIDLFIKISRGKWRSPLGDLSWTKGQPLGLFPSFGAFTLTHGLLLQHLANCEFHNQFFVVGDDVVILEDKLRDDYISMLDQMSCPWSGDKSISSNTLCEFAGKIVTSSMVIPQLKWRSLSDDNFLDIARLLGRKSYCLLSRRQKRVFDQVAHICEPIGLNFSLPGDNLTKMVERTLDFYRPSELILGSLLGLRKKLNHLVYTSSEKLDAEELQVISATFDEKVKSALSQTIFSNWENSLSLGLESLETLPEALGIKPRLPLKVCLPSRQTTLDRYERLLSQRVTR
jgi:hypothetical protein